MKPLLVFYRFWVMLFTKIGRLSFHLLAPIIVLSGLLLCSEIAFSQYELPPAVANLQTIRAGSLVIPMDTVYQRVPGSPGYFNLKSYGLVNTLLQNEIPVKWAIRVGKGRTTAANTIDFTTIVSRVFPDSLADSTISFRNGPFIVDSAWASRATPIIAAYGNNLFVYKLKNNTSIDIRYRLTFKPHLFLLNGGGYDTIAIHVLTEAGYSAGSYFKQTTGAVFVPASGNSLLSDTHYTPGDNTHVTPVMQFVTQYGGNLFTECAAIGAYENGAFIMTTNGIDSSSAGLTSPIAYSNPDLPIAQFLGPVFASYGEYRWWKPKTTPVSTFKTAVAYKIINGNNGNITIAGAKIRSNSEKGSNIFYLPGHDYYSYNNGSSNDNFKINGRRVFLNATLIPPNDSTNLDFITDIKLSMAVQPGFAVKNEPFKIYIILKNIGHWRAKNITVQAPFPVDLIYQSYSNGSGSFNGVTGVWTVDSLTKNQIDTLCITVLINKLGTISYSSAAVSQSLEDTLNNNTATINLFGVSRPVANIDTMNFFSPLFQDINTKGNDSDEDGGPFGNTQIIAGPYNGTAQVINGDTLRYTLNAGYSGVDSLRYVTCDAYPLCDTEWVYINIPFPLPVTLVRFDGKRNNGEVNLHWITLSEKNNDYFSIERGIDNALFETRGSVKGSGNSNSLKEYNFRDTDDNDLRYYYRLRQFDFNGQGHLSPVIALSKKQDNKVSFKLIPNPAGKSEQLLAVINGLQQGESLLRIADMTGRVIVKKALNISQGNQLEFVDIDNAIETGCYLVTLITPFETVSVRLIVQ